MFNVVLIEPEIPPNTGNIGRLCLATRSTLHLVKPLGFDLDDRQLQRAGLDYWKEVDLQLWDSFAELQAAQRDGARYFFLTTKVSRPYFEQCFVAGDFLVFGRETKGLPDPLLRANLRAASHHHSDARHTEFKPGHSRGDCSFSRRCDRRHPPSRLQLPIRGGVEQTEKSNSKHMKHFASLAFLLIFAAQVALAEDPTQQIQQAAPQKKKQQVRNPVNTSAVTTHKGQGVYRETPTRIIIRTPAFIIRS